MRGKLAKVVLASIAKDCEDNKDNSGENISKEMGSLNINNTIIPDDSINTINKMSFAIQQANARAERAARCAIRAAVTTKSGIDTSKEAIRGMRKTTFTMTDITDSLELIAGNIHVLCTTIILINSITNQVKLTLEQNYSNVEYNQEHKECADTFNKITQLIGELDDKTDQIAGIFEHVLSDMEKCSGAIRNGSRLVKEGYQVANETTMIMEKVMDTIEETSGQIDMILKSTEDAVLISNEAVMLIEDKTPRIVESL